MRHEISTEIPRLAIRTKILYSPLMTPQLPPPWRGRNGYRCRDLPTPIRQDYGTILVTGASGYIGGRLVPELICRGYHVRVMVRGDAEAYEEVWPDAEIVAADALDPASLDLALEGIGAAYYLIHSMVLGPEGFAEADMQAARNFRVAAEKAGVQRVVYLGGLGCKKQDLSPHLNSRRQVACELQSGTIATTVLRASVIIGSGSASFEIIKSLIDRLPVLPLPRWAFNESQPIGIRDVVKYLVGAMEAHEAAGTTYDIGGPEVLTYAAMMQTLAEVLGRRTRFFPVRISSTRLYGYIMSLITPVPAPITMCLIGGLKNDTVCDNNDIREIVPFKALPFREALVRALNREEQDHIATRWSDAYPAAHELSIKLHQLRRPPRYRAHYTLLTDCPAEKLFGAFTRIGGNEGWFDANWMWRMRGAIDRLFFGVGTQRGRRSKQDLRTHDVIDFWRVENIVPDQRLLLRAEMRMPGRAWLEFAIKPQGEQNELSITAHYATRSTWGDIYWRFFQPFHWYIFERLIKQVEQRALCSPAKT